MDIDQNQVYVYKMTPAYTEMAKNEKALNAFFAPIFQSGIIRPGDKVVLKPNWVKESHLYKPNDWEYVITHSEIIRFVLKNVIIELKDSGEIYIVDAPQTDSDYNEIIKRLHLPEIVEELQKTTKVPIKYYDLREERWFFKGGIIVSKKKLRGDPNGYVSVNLGTRSAFYNKNNKNYYGADYDTEETKHYHNDVDNIYVMSKTVLDCDVFINLPKMKTHKLAGITGSLKNLVGTCVVKNSIPHHTEGTPENGGDNFPNESRKHTAEGKLKIAALWVLKKKNPIINYPFIVIKWIAGLFLGNTKEKTIRNGAWYGNDTIWRATLDLNRILFCADKNGTLCDSQQRRYITFVDGIIAGEGEGPMAPDPKYSGVIISAINPVAADMTMAALMGFDYKKIPTLANAGKYDPTDLLNTKHDIHIVSNNILWQNSCGMPHFNNEASLDFRPHSGWKGHIENVSKTA